MSLLYELLAAEANRLPGWRGQPHRVRDRPGARRRPGQDLGVAGRAERDHQPGHHPGQRHRGRDGPSSTGRRPVCSMRSTASVTEAAGRCPGHHHAAGCPHSPRTTGANVAAAARRRTARSPTARWRRTAPRRRRPSRRRWPTRPRRAAAPGSGASPGPTSSARPTACRPGPGSASSPAAGSPAPARSRRRRARRPRARRRARGAHAVSRDDTHTASSTSPGSTTGTSRCEASGCHGTTAGSHSTVTTDQAMIRNGSPHSRSPASRIAESPELLESPERGGSPDRRRSTARPAAARAPPPPRTASSTAGTPRYHSTQYRLDS